MGTNYACVPRGSLLGVYLSCTSYMTDLKIASYQYEYRAAVWGGGPASLALRVLVVTQVMALGLA